MCYESPGPRCSSSARNKLQSKQSELFQAKQEVAEIENQYRTLEARLNPNDSYGRYEEDARALHVLSRSLDTSRMRLTRAQREVYKATDEYEETIGGMKELAAKAKNAKNEHVRAQANERLVKAKMRRNRKLDYYRQVKGLSKDGFNGNDDTHYVGDDERRAPSNPHVIAAVLTKNPTVPVFYHGSQESVHGKCEVLQIESTQGSGRYTLRTESGKFLEHVSGENMTLLQTRS